MTVTAVGALRSEKTAPKMPPTAVRRQPYRADATRLCAHAATWAPSSAGACASLSPDVRVRSAITPAT